MKKLIGILALVFIALCSYPVLLLITGKKLSAQDIQFTIGVIIVAIIIGIGLAVIKKLNHK